MKHCFVLSYSALSTHTAFSAVFKETYNKFQNSVTLHAFRRLRWYTCVAPILCPPHFTIYVPHSPNGHKGSLSVGE